MDTRGLILVTGATGTIGNFLVPCLLAKGYKVRVLVRDESRLAGRLWSGQVEVIEGDTFSMEALNRAMLGVWAAYYLIHNMSSGRNYQQRDLESARNFSSAACSAGVEHIIYLGGLANPAEEIGAHLRSRIQTGTILQEGCSPVTEFRASLIIGPGSISFEMIRYLTEQLPVIIGSSWLHNRVQPIAMENVLDYLLSALECEVSRGKIYEIGGEDVLTYEETLMTYARLRGLRRVIINLPFLPVKLIAYFASKLTPVPACITLPLIDGMRSNSLVCEDSARRDFPGINLVNYRTSVQNALLRLSPTYLESLSKKGEGCFRFSREGFYIEVQQVNFDADPNLVYRAVTSLGGANGWLYLNWLWRLRGWIDKMLGGPGMRGRPAQDTLNPGDTVDFYRVETLRPGRMLRLKADLKAPGVGWMEWRIHPGQESRVGLEQVAYFLPHGLFGFLYWNLLYPVHHLIFNGLIRAIARQAILIQNQADVGELSQG